MHGSSFEAHDSTMSLYICHTTLCDRSSVFGSSIGRKASKWKTFGRLMYWMRFLDPVSLTASSGISATVTVSTVTLSTHKFISANYSNCYRSLASSLPSIPSKCSALLNFIDCKLIANDARCYRLAILKIIIIND